MNIAIDEIPIHHRKVVMQQYHENEAHLCNRIVLGMNENVYMQTHGLVSSDNILKRVTLSQYCLIQTLKETVFSLTSIDMDYDERKRIIQDSYDELVAQILAQYY